MLTHNVDPDEFLEFVHDIDHSVVQPEPGARRRHPAAARQEVHLHQRLAPARREGRGAARLPDAFRGHLRHRRRQPRAEAGARKPTTASSSASRIEPERAAMFEDLARNLVVPESHRHDDGARRAARHARGLSWRVGVRGARRRSRGLRHRRPRAVYSARSPTRSAVIAKPSRRTTGAIPDGLSLALSRSILGTGSRARYEDDRGASMLTARLGGALCATIAARSSAMASRHRAQCCPARLPAGRR